MKKVSLLLAAGVLILGACADPSSTEESKKDAPSSEQDKSNEKKAENEKPEKPEQPFKPLKPSEDAVALDKSLSEKEQQEIPDMQALLGGNPERTVPAGETLAEGLEDPSDGPLKNHRLVAYYGTPDSENMGILGELEPEEYMKKLKEQTQAYSDADPDRPAVPTIELITTMAQSEPGPDGDYVRMTSEENIEKYVELAEKHDALVLLDIQLGTDTVMEQVKMVEKWLKHPHVHLAIDTEFHVAEGEKPGDDLGQVDGKEIQKAVEYVSELTEKNNLPDKFVLVHQFTGAVLSNKEAIQPTDNVEIAINFDGWGASADKQALYGKYIREEPKQYGAFKIFYNKDVPVMEPEDVLKMEPSPAIINYQ
ncbi:hypothetical protein [Rossellomorea aquimaris]|uniref:Lipoprotein n=1 Tax=Rossellomorea aquimaris TaxID=189382 RepID=A0A366EET0_9BACI|nr:hypothetical protein [Rossellomorea aquimaris]RBP00833.1 hypothetical protein DET59_12435 [Rossellomorea aquimaris]